MMRMKTKPDSLGPQTNGGGGGGGTGEGRREKEWELRPGGMLVQKRSDGDQARAPPPMIRVRVKYNSLCHETHVSSQATFGELKKILSGPTGLHHLDQKIFYKGKEKDSNAYLDTSGVKDKSKLVLEEDLISREKRYLEMRKNAKTEKAEKTISQVTLEVDKLAKQVSSLETVISKGGKVVEKDIINMTDLLMNQLLKLDGIIAEGDVKMQKKKQEGRVQKYVEALDILKLKNSPATGNGKIPNEPLVHTHSNGSVSSPVQSHRNSNGSVSSPVQKQQSRHSFGESLLDSPIRQQPSRNSASGTAVVITTQWETFDAPPAPLIGSPSTSTTTKSAAPARPPPPQPNFTWDLL
ncbi:BAG family molecular chaperone regulator 1-like [Andrographis paniculata]|uniref:BAG family molecular chaperone regulator 1-like n=1 Tax=Andrographis paniculata TaxID=175694 RepID=UPI0021E7FEF5|nr:BAG family molecular chaperone regulator 1-like [Andrographis paniculata]